VAKQQKVDLFLRERVAFLVTLCERETERTCPIFPGATWRLVLVRRARDEIRDYVTQFVQEHE
jgi:hypothetical protein